MTLRRLLEHLTGVPLDATVRFEVYDDCQDGEYCGENGAWVPREIAAVNYNAQTNTVTLREN